MDPLALLQEAVIKGTLAQVTESGDRIRFGDRFSFPKVCGVHACPCGAHRQVCCMMPLLTG